MDDHLRLLFKEELREQCRYAAMAAQDLEAALSERFSPRIWYAIQNILVAAANCAKLLWGSEGPAIEESRQPIRDMAGVDDSSPLKRREVRNAFEHFDEYMVQWFNAGDTKVFVSRNVGPPGAIVIEGQVPAREFGHFDPATGIVTFWKRSVSIRELLSEIERIYGQISPE
jgi:hypothetical protein